MTEITTASLSKALSDMRINVSLGGTFTPSEDLDLLSRIIDCPDEFGGVPEDLKDEFQRTRSLKSFLGAKGLKAVWAYQEFREQIQKVQVENNVSAIEEKSILLCGERLHYLDFDDQLKLLDRDVPLLKNQVAKIVELFLRVEKCPTFHLFESLDDESQTPFSSEGLDFLASSCNYAWIHGSSHDWVKQEDGAWRGTTADRDPPDSVTLGLFWGHPEDPYVSRYFELIDLDKQPWSKEDLDSLLA